MSKHVTAIYRTHAIAAEVKNQIDALGVSGHEISIIPDETTAVAPGTHRADRHVDAVNGLNLPDDDQRTYRRAVRDGNYLVSVKLSDDTHTSRIEEIMRHPEHALDLDAYDTEYRSHPDYATDVERDRALGQRDGLMTRDTDRVSPYGRTYY